MGETLLTMDRQFFLLINHLPHNALLDTINLLLSGIGTAGLVWFILGVILILKEEKKDLPTRASLRRSQAGHWFLAPIIAAGATSWVLVEKIIKPWVARARPSPEIGAMIIGDGRSDFSFPSGHATIAWAMAVVLSRKEPKLRWLFYTLALLISFSRVYLGKHFPSDVIAGGFLGFGIGFTVRYLFENVAIDK